MNSKQAWMWWSCVFASLILFGSIASILPSNAIGWIIAEDGIVQPLSALGYLIGLCLLAYCSRKNITRYWYGLVLLAFLCLREFDFDTRFFTGGLFNSRQYFTDKTSLLEKLISAPIAMFLIGSLVWLIIKHGKATVTAVLKLNPLAWSYCAALGMATASVVLDGLGRRLGNMGINLRADLNLLSVVLEEIVELYIPAFIILALVIYYTSSRNSKIRTHYDAI